MTKHAHTKGPWVVGLENRVYANADVSPDGISKPHALKDAAYQTICHVTAGLQTGDREANARLIAAAPELLDVVLDIVSDCKGVINSGLYDLAVKAIAKARGH